MAFRRRVKLVEGQITFEEILNPPLVLAGCGSCVCKSCLYHCSSRCPYGHCYDDLRAKKDPFNKAHPEQAPRKLWSDWNKLGEQAHWCRGGIFYPTHSCDGYVMYEGSEVEECVGALIVIYQDGYISCSLKESMGCEACVERYSNSEEPQIGYACHYMTDTGCERMITAKSLMMDAISEGEDMELCLEQCCIGCKKICGYRCGQAG